MSDPKANEYTVEDIEAAVILSQINMWSRTFDNDSDVENIPPLSPLSSPSPDDSCLNAASTPAESLPGPSSASDTEHYDSGKNDSSSHENRKFSYKLNLYERYKKEQLEWALEKHNMMVKAGDNVSETADEGQKMDAGCRTTRKQIPRRKVVRPKSKRNVRLVNRINMHNMHSENSKSGQLDNSDGTFVAMSPPRGSSLPVTRVTDNPLPEENSIKTKIGNISVSSKLLKQLPRLKANKATRKLLEDVFSRRVLATHSLTGRPSPAFPDKPVKRRLDPAMVKTIIDLVLARCEDANERDIRFSITTKCADECKMLRFRLSKEG